LHNKKVLSLSKKQCAALSSLLLLGGNLAIAQKSQLPDGPGKATMQKICSGCHAPEIVLGRRDTKEGWAQVVSSMVDRGANGTDDEFNAIIDYLAANFPKDASAKQSDNTSSDNSGAKK
jgi:cytochrome c5